MEQRRRDADGRCVRRRTSLHGARLLVAGAAVLQLAAALGCTGERVTPKSDGNPGAEASARRYWLKNVVLYDAPGGKPVRYLDAPVLGDVSRDGRVQSLPDGAERFAGYLPGEVLTHPQDDGGLMLHAQRATPLRLGAPEGPVVGTLHPGAFVSVAAGDVAAIAVGSLGFAHAGKAQVYARRADLGPEPVEWSPPRGGAGTAVVWGQSLTLERGGTRFRSQPCHAIWLPDSGPATQRVGRVELVGWPRGELDAAAQPRSYEALLRCPARVVSQHASRLFLTRDDGSEVEVFDVPAEFQRVAVPHPDPLHQAVVAGEPVFWLVYAPPDLQCVEARFEHAHRFSTPTRLLTRGKLVLDAGARGSYDVEYRPSVPLAGATRAPPGLRLEWNGSAEHAMECDYSLVGTDGPTLLVLGSRLAPGAIAFDPGQTERWYQSAEDCARARASVQQQLRDEPRGLPEAGLHVPLP